MIDALHALDDALGALTPTDDVACRATLAAIHGHLFNEARAPVTPAQIGMDPEDITIRFAGLCKAVNDEYLGG